MRTPRLYAVSLIVTVGIAAASADRTEAAVRLCKTMTSSGLQEARSEQEARALAISAWVTAASSHGERYAGWRVAIDKLIACSATADGRFWCLAKATPCTISQVPKGDTVPYKKQGIDG